MRLIILLICFLSLLQGCDFHTMALIPNDLPIIDTDTIDDTPIDTIPVDTIPIDTIVDPIDTVGNPVDSIIVDTCEVYHPITSPAFVSFFVNKDVLMLPIQWYYDTKPINIDSFFETVGTGHQIFYSGANIGGVVDGTSNSVQFGAHIRCRDGSGALHSFAFWSQGLYFRGALTFDQTMEVLIVRPSARLISFSNTGFTCDQVHLILDFLLADCKAGLGIIDLRSLAPGCVTPDEVLELQERGWDVWL